MPVLQVLFDLLSSSPGTPEDLTIVDEGGVTAVKGLSQVQVQSEAEALALLFEGERIEDISHASCSHHAQGRKTGSQQHMFLKLCLMPFYPIFLHIMVRVLEGEWQQDHHYMSKPTICM